MRKAWNGPPTKDAVGDTVSVPLEAMLTDRSGALPATWKVKVAGAESPPGPEATTVTVSVPMKLAAGV